MYNILLISYLMNLSFSGIIDLAFLTKINACEMLS